MMPHIIAVLLVAVPKIVDLTRDPRETRQVAEPYNGWLQYPMVKLIVGYQSSLLNNPNVLIGSPDSYKQPVQ